MPNAMVGKQYDATVALTIRTVTDLPRNVRSGELTILSRQVGGLEQIGLKAEPIGERIHISGNPIEAGDHPVVISFTVQIRGQHWITEQRQFILTVNPDPRSLWKEIEPDPSLPYRRPHTAKSRLVGDSVLVAASRRGRSHANKGDYRDDDFRLDSLPEQGWYVMAVADGAGSAPLSRRGAELACSTVCGEIRQYMTTILDVPFSSHLEEFARTSNEGSRKQIQGALYQSLGAVGCCAFKQIVTEAEGCGRPLGDFATTLIFTIARKYDFGWFVAAIAVGDGGIGVYQRDGEVHVLNRPDTGDFAGQTRFLTMPHIWANYEEITSRIHFKIIPDFTAVIAMTDGVTDPKFSHENAFFNNENWHAFWKELSDEVGLLKDNASADEQLLEWLNFWAVGNHDDRTIAILLP
jgi:hypothetical protein